MYSLITLEKNCQKAAPYICVFIAFTINLSQQDWTCSLKISACNNVPFLGRNLPSCFLKNNQKHTQRLQVIYPVVGKKLPTRTHVRNWPLAFLAVKLSDLQVNDKHFNLIGSQNKIMTQLYLHSTFPEKNFNWKNQRICHPASLQSYVGWLRPLISTTGEILSGFFPHNFLCVINIYFTANWKQNFRVQSIENSMSNIHSLDLRLNCSQLSEHAYMNGRQLTLMITQDGVTKHSTCNTDFKHKTALNNPSLGMIGYCLLHE